ncbi:hypothetical protein PN36_25645 [Candidatus Thiomargarita nelsonii]|uniref:RNA polymerase sigma factor 70 region 4 type 2 domain-containing protein n=1 Tax=Candidatus Thiomargarita nelsonii TaxID=1003181 RepID=A0A0A6P3Y4_9GAMM|nr:hypothetical protein PN36_25645 [Candidatus Thiomargarita nelsonii]
MPDENAQQIVTEIQNRIDQNVQERNNLTLQDCLEMAIAQYEREHPCERCVWRIDLPKHLNEIAQIVQQGIMDCDKLNKDARAHMRKRRQNPNHQIPDAVQLHAKCLEQQGERKQAPNLTCCQCLLIFKLRMVFGYDNEEIALILGTTQAAVRQLASRCFARMRQWQSADKAQPDLKTCREYSSLH